MMNMFEQSEKLKDFSQEQLVQEMKQPSGVTPPFLVLSEMQRRARMKQSADASQPVSQTTVAQDAVNAAGVPQGGIAPMMQAMAPQTDVTQNTGQAAAPTMKMARGGVVKMQPGGLAGISSDVRSYSVESDPAVALMAARLGMSPAEYLASLDPEARAQNLRRIERNRMLAMEPAGDGMTFPTQADLDQRFREPAVTPEMLTERGISQGGANPSYVESDAVPTYFPDTAINSTMSGGLAALAPPEQVAPYVPPSSAPFTAADRAEMLAALNEGRPYQPSPRRRDAPEGLALPSADVVDVRTSAADAPLDRSYQPPTMGATELNSPAMIAALRGPEPTAAGATNMGSKVSEFFDPSYYDSTSPNYRLNESDPQVLAQQSAEEAAALRDAAGITESLRTQEDKDAAAAAAMETVRGPGEETPQTTPARTTTTSGGSAAASAAAQGGSDNDRMLEQDKWLALARFGAALSSSKAPTFGQALGEAGNAGLDALGQARADYQIRKQRAEDNALARATLAARMARSGAARPIPAGIISMLQEQRNALAAEYGSLPDPESTWFGFGEPVDPVAAERTALSNQLTDATNRLNYALGTQGVPMISTGAPYDRTIDPRQ